MTEHQQILGVETEYGLVGTDTSGETLDPELLSKQVIDLAKERLEHLPDLSSYGLFLTSGMRLYRDGPNGALEVATPECLDPFQVAAYVRAGDFLVRKLARERETSVSSTARVVALRNAVTYPAGQPDVLQLSRDRREASTRGQHECYSIPGELSIRDLALPLLSHLASRPLLTGEGGFDPTGPLPVFTRSARLELFEAVSGHESTQHRSIWHRKDESLTDGTTKRVHLICGGTSITDATLILKVGATGLVLAAACHGVKLPPMWRVSKPLEALHTWLRNPSARVRCGRGARASAGEVQEAYIDCVAARPDVLPPYADRIFALWRATLTQVREDPGALQNRLDWPLKESLYRAYVENVSTFTWKQVCEFSDFLSGIWSALQYHCPASSIALDELLDKERSPFANHMDFFEPSLKARGLTWEQIRELLRLKAELFLLDTRFGELSSEGVVAQMEDDFRIEQMVPRSEMLHAVDHPPRGTRAELRGALVRELAKERRTCLATWTTVVDRARKRFVNLNDPFATNRGWESIDENVSTRALRGLPSEQAAMLVEIIGDGAERRRRLRAQLERNRRRSPLHVGLPVRIRTMPMEIGESTSRTAVIQHVGEDEDGTYYELDIDASENRRYRWRRDELRPLRASEDVPF